jgi:hypothetical protein
MYVLVRTYPHRLQLYAETETLYLEESEVKAEMQALFEDRFFDTDDTEILAISKHSDFQEMRDAYLKDSEGTMGLDLCSLMLSPPLRSLVLSTIQQLARLESSGPLREQWHAILDAEETFSSEHERLAAWAARESSDLTEASA